MTVTSLYNLRCSGEQVLTRSVPAQGEAAPLVASDPAGERQVQVQHLWQGEQDQQRSFQSQVEVPSAQHSDQDGALHSKRDKSSNSE